MKPKRPIPAPSDISDALVRAAKRLGADVGRIEFAAPVACTYNPLIYAWPMHAAYLRAFGRTAKRVVFLGMNPGPFGMAQTGVPFGEVRAVREWLGLSAPIGRPKREHPRRPVTGLDCARSEVSGRRLWGLFADRFRIPANFFADHIVLNYCPLAFVENTGRNRTPDKLAPAEKAALFAACDAHLRAAVAALQPEWLIGIGDFALGRAREALSSTAVKSGRIAHPSPANPAANRGWPALATRQLLELGVWK